MGLALSGGQRPPRPVILGAGPNGYGLARSLAQAGIRAIVADCNWDVAFLSHLIAGRWRVPDPEQDQAACQALGRHLERLSGEAMLIPTNEPWVHLLNQHRAELGARAHLVLAEEAVIEVALGKSRMHAWCLEHGVPEPETLVFTPGGDWPGFLAWAQDHLPVILKPDTKGLGGRDCPSTCLEFSSARRLRAWAKGLGPQGPPFVLLAQNYIHGPQVGLAAWHGYRSAQGQVFMVGLTKLRSRPPHLGGCTTAGRFGADEATRGPALRLLTELGYSGFFDLEFLLSPGRPPLFVELNPRVGLPNYAATAMGLNLPLLALLHCRDGAGLRGVTISQAPGLWLDLTCDPLLALSGRTREGRRLGLGAWLHSLRSRPLVDACFDRRDPLVLAAALLRLVGLGLAQVLRPRWRGLVRWGRARRRTGWPHRRPGAATRKGGPAAGGPPRS